jgi:hypothetical protein
MQVVLTMVQITKVCAIRMVSGHRQLIRWRAMALPLVTLVWPYGRVGQGRAFLTDMQMHY